MKNNHSLIEKYVYNLYNALRDAYYASNFGFSVIRLIFLKYAADNSLGSCNMNDMSAYLRLHKMLSAVGKTNIGANAIAPVLSIIDNHYGLNGLLSSTADEFASDLFGLDIEKTRQTASEKNISLIFESLNQMDLEDDQKFSKGKALASALVDNMHRYMASRYTAPHVSRNELCTLAKRILKINDSDVFMDFAAGIGATSTAITENTNCRVINYDIDPNVLPISAMLHIMSGINNFTFAQKDFTQLISNSNTSTVNKIFVDPALITGYLGQRELRILAIDTATHLLSDNGKAIITATAGTLSNGATRLVQQRKAFVNERFISHVVALPITWASTTATINLIILTKTKNDHILMVNACSNTFKGYVEPQSARMARLSPPISEEGIDLLVDIINNKKEVPALSRKVSIDEIINRNYDIFPATYIFETSKIDLTIDAIDKELAELYNSLQLLI